MLIRNSYYVTSSAKVSQCPVKELPEYSFIGRSNVGKSSLINYILDRKGLAKTSGKPGKTQTINHYLINDEWFIADLPGYGYAKVSKTSRRKWEQMIRDYLLKREQLMCSFLLVDGTIKPQVLDLEFANWLGEMQLPFKIIFTKVDKMKKEQDKEQFVNAFIDEMLLTWEEMPPYFVTSSTKDTGRDAILADILEMNKLFTK